MVETALVLTVMLAMIIFGVDMARMLLFQEFFTERAREGARNAVVHSWDATATANFICYGTSTTPPGGTTTPGYLGLLPSQVSVTSVGDSGVNDARIEVQISGVRMFSWIPFMSGNLTAAPVVATAPLESRGATN